MTPRVLTISRPNLKTCRTVNDFKTCSTSRAFHEPTQNKPPTIPSKQYRADTRSGSALSPFCPVLLQERGLTSMASCVSLGAHSVRTKTTRATQKGREVRATERTARPLADSPRNTSRLRQSLLAEW